MAHTYTFHVNGMHCKACVFLTESELSEHPQVRSAKTSLEKQTVVITGDFGDTSEKDIAEELSKSLSQHSLSLETQIQKAAWHEFVYAIPIAIGFIFLFIVLQKLGLANLIQSDTVNIGTAFLIGLIASVSSCMAIVGGLLLSLSTTYARQGAGKWPQISFHLSRIIAFALLGGVTGLLGSVLKIGVSGTAILGILVALTMLILGVNLLEITPWTKKLQPTLPGFFSKQAQNLNKQTHVFVPALVGVSTFFLPCGFTQSMQLYALSSGSFLKGATTMLFFALGTLPVLACISFTSSNIAQNKQSGILFKTAGLIVILFAVFNLLNSFAALGWMEPLFNFF